MGKGGWRQSPKQTIKGGYKMSYFPKPKISENMLPDPYKDEGWVKGRGPHECGKWYFVRMYDAFARRMVTEIDYRTYERIWRNNPLAVLEWQEIREDA